MMLTRYYFRVKWNRDHGSFYLGFVDAPDSDAATARAEARWPHWKNELEIYDSETLSLQD